MCVRCVDIPSSHRSVRLSHWNPNKKKTSVPLTKSNTRRIACRGAWIDSPTQHKITLPAQSHYITTTYTQVYAPLLGATSGKPTLKYAIKTYFLFESAILYIFLFSTKVAWRGGFTTRVCSCSLDDCILYVGGKRTLFFRFFARLRLVGRRRNLLQISETQRGALDGAAKRRQDNAARRDDKVDFRLVVVVVGSRLCVVWCFCWIILTLLNESSEHEQSAKYENNFYFSRLCCVAFRDAEGRIVFRLALTFLLFYLLIFFFLLQSAFKLVIHFQNSHNSRSSAPLCYYCCMVLSLE